jgi:diguanylate cyclase (GGDEF)-like protein
LQRSIANAERHMRKIAVLFIDLDRFKEVNDTLGHTIGDELLVEVAKRLSGHIRTGDLLSRLGGDEFVCVLENVDSPFEAASVAEKLNDRIAGPIELRNHSLQISASIGIAIYPQDGADTDNLLRAADTAMYQAKKMGRNTHHFYTPEMTQHARERVAMERLLRKAIANNELEVHYQIKMTVGDTPQPCGAEALVRWTNPELGSVPPVRFIPVAEETGFIVELGRWMLRTACQQAALWRAQGLLIPKMSVNLSVRQLERADHPKVRPAATISTSDRKEKYRVSRKVMYLPIKKDRVERSPSWSFKSVYAQSVLGEQT